MKKEKEPKMTKKEQEELKLLKRLNQDIVQRNFTKHQLFMLMAYIVKEMKHKEMDLERCFKYAKKEI